MRSLAVAFLRISKDPVGGGGDERWDVGVKRDVCKFYAAY